MFPNAAYGNGAELFKLESRRAGFFILDVPPAGNVSTGTEGLLYLRAAKNNNGTAANEPAGTFKVLEIHDGKCLCGIVSIRPGTDASKITGAAWKKNNPKPPAPKPVSLTFEGGKIDFLPLPGGTANKRYYISNRPFPLDKVEPLTVSGLKSLLSRVEKQTGKRYRTEFIRFSQVRSLAVDRVIDFSDKNKIILGTRDGKLCMINSEDGELHTTFMSPATLEKFKTDLYLYIILYTTPGKRN